MLPFSLLEEDCTCEDMNVMEDILSIFGNTLTAASHVTIKMTFSMKQNICYITVS